ncbi:glycoside hydrolase family 3 C-terminal domain-containing protein [Nocardioides sp. R-C-SC26]|uniref:glycoside hydrolase family 3 C-terminal domain-containing protein n=1 Tax=Nocardioides sp. R-C-SC26 TaxID=2870414 RepID=UPI001E3ACC78|nr:glycoside hydrolase family 3 N-terminal domain-containing protein [Nocardioides sp. R-C-SC26]
MTESVHEAAAEIVARLELRDKAALITGATFWSTHALDEHGVPELVLTDGPHGVRRQRGSADHLGIHDSLPATCFPTASATGSSWNTELLEEIGRALGAEARWHGVGVLLGPGLNIKRTPLCGRNFEYYSEDPVLSGDLAPAAVTGVQAAGVGACLKHFAANNQETNRMVVSSDVDERTLRELYLTGFERAVTASAPAAVMSSYNRINGVHAAQHPWLLTEVLREEWGFAGLVVSDWGGVPDAVASLAAGLDLEMPGNAGTPGLVVAAVESGRLAVEELDRAAAAVVAAALALGAPSDAAAAGAPLAEPDWDAHHELARRAAVESAVLLTNDGVLPLAGSGPIALVGALAAEPRYQGGGSSRVVPTRLDDLPTELARALADRPGVVRDLRVSASDDVDAALAAADGAGVVVVVLGLTEGDTEGADRTHLDLPVEQLSLLAAVRKAGHRVVAVLTNGGIVLTGQVEQHADAVLEMWLSGQAGSAALADILTGLDDPRGRLAETIPVRLTDTPAYLNFPGTEDAVLYGERLYVGYRGYDATDRDVAHAFGSGLAYTTFGYTDLEVTLPDPGTAAATVSCTVTNTGDRAGSDVVQVYLGEVAPRLDRPVRELVGFAKVRLQPGASQRVSVELGHRDFAFYDVAQGQWIVDPGAFEIAVGPSSRDLPLRATVTLEVPRIGGEITLDSPMSTWLDTPAAFEALMAELHALAKQAGMDVPDVELLRLADSMPFRKLLEMGGVTLDADRETDLLNRANA